MLSSSCSSWHCWLIQSVLIYSVKLSQREFFKLKNVSHPQWESCFSNLYRIQSLQGLVSYAHWDVPIANTKGEMMFRSWKDLFDTNGEMSYQSPRLYSFNGRDVMHDSAWYVCLSNVENVQFLPINRFNLFFSQATQANLARFEYQRRQIN